MSWGPSPPLFGASSGLRSRLPPALKIGAVSDTTLGEMRVAAAVSQAARRVSLSHCPVVNGDTDYPYYETVSG